ncbi:MAG: aminopeptidase P family protein [Clostridia bacterium]
MKNQIERLREKLITDESQAILITSSMNRRYFSSFKSSAGIILITANEAFMLMDFRYAEAATLKAKNVTVQLAKNFDISLGELIVKNKIETIHLESETLTYSAVCGYKKLFKSLNATAVLDGKLNSVITALRMIKSADEIKKIEAAQKITDGAFAHALTCIKEGVTELDIALEIEFYMKKQGAESLAFDSIVVAGAKTSQCHGVPDNSVIHHGDFITMDIGAKLDGYCSDMTRTVVLGEASEEQKAIYNTVLLAHNKAMEAVKPGMICSDIDKIARDIIDPIYPNAFGHGLGHSLGLEVHENPRFSPLCHEVLEAGMIITDEPGVYIAGKGGVRIEDMVLVTENGSRSLTNSPKELIIL